MPKTFLVDEDIPDFRKTWPIIINVEEWVLEKTTTLIKNNNKSFPVIEGLLKPWNDYKVGFSDLAQLMEEINSLNNDLTQIEDGTIEKEVVAFYFLLDGLCLAAIQTKRNIYGFAD